MSDSESHYNYELVESDQNNGTDDLYETIEDGDFVRYLVTWTHPKMTFYDTKSSSDCGLQLRA